ncbi:MAG: autotransporter outer membrane beta-barrel domain-containing protein [Opitutaceae bacterium]|jgi:outer membrane autotransporter protein|nr:autotransporter outer membrane beta-barrel domain-containing protein [Opitutaceae bacterium]
MPSQTTRLPLLSALLLTAFFSGPLNADPITLTDSGTRLVLSGIAQNDDIVSTGTGNSVELQTTGTLAGSLLGTPGIDDSGFTRLAMHGDYWRLSGTAELLGTSATTFHIATGTLALAGRVLTGGTAAGDAATITIDPGATLLFSESGTAAAAAIVNNGRILVSRPGTTYLTYDISGDGLIETENTVWLTGTNTHTGGVLASTGNLYVRAPSALGTGTVTLNTPLTSGGFWVAPDTAGDFLFDNPLVGTGRIIVNMTSGTDVFAFGPATGTGFGGIFIMQVGTLHLSGATDAVLANASNLRLDRGANITIGAGAHTYNGITTSANGAVIGTPIVLSFESDFSNPAGPAPARVNIDTFSVAANTVMKIQVEPKPGVAVVAPWFVVTPSGASLLQMDEASASLVTGTLLAMNPGKNIATADLARILHAPLTGSGTAAARLDPIVQAGGTVANFVSNYFTTATTSGIYLNYGLVGIETLAGKTLTLADDLISPAGANDWKLPISGGGNLDIAATRSITLSSRWGNFTGAATITSGTLIMTGILGTGTVTINPGAVLQIGNGTAPNATGLQPVPYAGGDIVNNGTLLFSLGNPTAADMVAISSNISGTSALTINGGRITLTGTNTFTGGLIINSSANESYAEKTVSLGSGTVTIRGGKSLWLLPDNTGDQVWTQPLSTEGNGRVIVRMFDAADTFSFQNGATLATSGTGDQSRESFILQRGTFLLDDNAVAIMAGRKVRVDGGATLKIVPGTQHFKSLKFDPTDNSGLGYRILSFDADFSNPAAPVLSHLLLDALEVTTNLTLRFDSSSPLGTIPTPAVPPNANLLTMDDDTGNNVFSGTLLSFSSPGRTLSALEQSRLLLDQQIYVNGTAADTLSTGGDFIQNSATVGRLLYGYNLSSDNKGVYLNAGLAGIEVLEGQTLTLSGDTTGTPGANEFSLRMTGSGGLDIRATESITISNRSNTLAGMTTVATGTLLLTGNLPGGVTIDPGATLQIGNLSAFGEVGGSLVHNGTLLLRRSSGTIAANISGAGQVALDYGSNIWLTGSNSHTGGVHFAGPAASFYLGSAGALGTGTMSIAPSSANIRIDVWMRPSEKADFIIDNPVAWSATNSRLIVFMPEPGYTFGFGNAPASTFEGIFIGQRGTYDLSGDTGAVLAGATSLRFDRGSNIILGSSGTTILRSVEFSHLNPAANATGGTDPYARILFDADFSDPQNPAILSNLLVTERLSIGTSTRVQLNYTGDIPVPAFTPPETGANILAVDDEINRHGFAAKLISLEPSAVLTGPVNWLANMVLLNAAGDRLNAANGFDFMQDGEKIGTGYANYFIGQQADGLYMNYGFAELHIDAGKTLALYGDTAQDDSFIAMLSGEGNVDIRATNTIKLGTYNGESSLTGAVTLHSGTLAFATPVALSSASRLALAPGTAMNLNFTNQAIGALDAPASTTIDLHSGRLTIARNGAIDGALTGNGIITVANNATLDVGGGDNPGLDANWIVAPGATLRFHAAGAAGIGRVSGSNANTSAILLAGLPDGEFNAEVTGNGVLTIASSTLAMTKGVSISTFKIETSDLTVRHAGGLNATTTEALDSIIRIDTSSHIQAGTLRLDNSTLAFVPQRHGAFGNLLVNALETTGTATIRMNADLTRAGAADSIIVLGNLTGSYELDITNVAPGGRGDDAVAHRVVRAPEPTGADPDPRAHFTLKNGSIEAGAFTFELLRGDPENAGFLMTDPLSYYLAVANASPLSRAAQAVLSTAAIAGAEWRYSLDSLNKRMGELRQEIFLSGKNDFNNTWGRSSAYSLKAADSLAGVAFDETVYNFSFGIDVGHRFGRSSLLLGLYGDIGYVDRDFDDRGTGSTNSHGAGLYATWLHETGWYADFSFLAATRKNKFTALALDGTSARGDYTGKSFSGSLEVGRRINLPRSWWLEPGVQFAVADFFRSNYTTDNGIAVHIPRTTARQTRLQVRLGRDDGESRLRPYGRLALARCDDGALNITANGRALPGDTNADDTRCEFGAGASIILSENSQLYLEYEYAQADHYKRPWALNAGLRRFW